MYDIYYEGADKERINFCQWPYMVTGGDLFDGSYDEIEDDDRIQGFKKKITSKTLNIEIAKTGLISLEKAVDTLEDIIEKDIVNMTPGRLYVGESYMKCWISKSEKGRWIYDQEQISADLKVVSDYPYWIKEETFRYYKQQEDSVEEYLDYPYDMPHDYKKTGSDQTINNNNHVPSGFKMIIYGPCINPLIRINNHVYELKTELQESEYIIIDSSTRYARDRKIIKVKKDGTEENVFNSKNNESSIFEKIPVGISTVSWNGSFGFDIILFCERGTPKWTSMLRT